MVKRVVIVNMVKVMVKVIGINSTFKQENVVEFTFDEWEVFVKGVKSGEFDI